MPTRRTKPNKNNKQPNPPQRKLKNKSIKRSNKRRPQKQMQPLFRELTTREHIAKAGGNIGSYLGDKLGGILSIVTGNGDYTVLSNTLMTDTPSFANTGEVRFTQKEFIADIKGNTSFLSLMHEPITPSNPNLFPWLSEIAPAFEEYEIRGLLFHYKPTSGTAINSSSAALGYVVMSTQYNPYSDPYTNKQSMENYQYTTSGAPYEAQLHAVECDRSLTQQPILSVLPPSGITDLRFTQFGLFNIAAGGFPSSGTIAGELWVTYDIIFYKKVQRSLCRQNHYTLTPSQISGTTPMSGFNGNTTAFTPDLGSTLGGTMTADYFEMPDSFYGVLAFNYNYFSLAPDTANTLIMTPSGNATAYKLLDYTNKSYLNGFSTISYNHVAYFLFNGGGRITWSVTAAWVVTCTSADLIVTEMSLDRD